MKNEALTGCGIGLRKEHFDRVLEERPDVPFFEVISENFMVAGGRPLHVLDRVRENYPVALHGVSMNLGSADPLDAAYLARLRALVDCVEPAIVSDHLCWTGLSSLNSHDLLPLPFTEEAVRHVAAKIRRAQDVLGRRLLVENVSSYVSYRASELTEADFLTAVVREADCHLLLDVNNLYVNARNHGFDAAEALRAIPPDRVRQFHLAGHEDHGDVVIDTHDHPVADDVWVLYRRAVRRFGAQPTLLEWDANVPELEVLLEEARLAAVVQRSWAKSERFAA
ncbi:MAG TPA: DUF692 domain-containing protein [Thermoanaerobaculia bacterium]|nr:DUF692 domain-containing protein [Thermoanaerobaculia bacterium]